MGYVLLIGYSALSGWLLWFFSRFPSVIALPAVTVNFVAAVGVLLHAEGWPLLTTVYAAATAAYVYAKHVGDEPAWNQDDYAVVVIAPAFYLWPAVVVASAAEWLSPGIW